MGEVPVRPPAALLAPLLHDVLRDTAHPTEAASQRGTRAEEGGLAPGSPVRRGGCRSPPRVLFRAKPTERMLPVGRTQIPPLLEKILMVPIFFSKSEQNKAF